ncbi:MAG TPA: ribonuclease III [Clostridiales bacterium]|nr:ribonuclease III [Clostridiales bacterium]
MESDLLKMDTSVLAYLGDAVFSSWIRRRLIEAGWGSIDRLHRQTVRYVRADAQAAALAFLTPGLTEQEADLARRARNKRISSKPRHTDPLTYKKATAFEALVGYLYLAGETERLNELLEQAAAYIEGGGGNEPG